MNETQKLNLTIKALVKAKEALRVAHQRFRALTWGEIVTPEHSERTKEIYEEYLSAKISLDKLL